MTLPKEAIAAPLRVLLQRARERTLPDGWLFRATGETTLDTPCLMLPDEAYDEPEEMEEAAAKLGYPSQGLDTQTLGDLIDGLALLTRNPSEANILRAYCYYAEFDAFLPSLDAPDPPPIKEWRLTQDREFLDLLGEESRDRQCRKENCQRGAVALSVLCRKHHFESVWKRPCPVD